MVLFVRETIPNSRWKLGELTKETHKILHNRCRIILFDDGGKQLDMHNIVLAKHRLRERYKEIMSDQADVLRKPLPGRTLRQRNVDCVNGSRWRKFAAELDGPNADRLASAQSCMTSSRRRLYQVPVPTSAIFKWSLSSGICGFKRPPNSSLNRWCWELSLPWSTHDHGRLLALCIWVLPHNWVVVPTQRIVISCIIWAGHWYRASGLVKSRTMTMGGW